MTKYLMNGDSSKYLQLDQRKEEGKIVQLGLGLIVQLGLGLKLNTKIQIHHHPPPHRNSSEGCRPSRRLRINMQAYLRLRN